MVVVFVVVIDDVVFVGKVETSFVRHELLLTKQRTSGGGAGVRKPTPRYATPRHATPRLAAVRQQAVRWGH